jgi:hypothetical protein
MATTGRVGTGLLGTFGLALAGLMVYTLGYEGCSGPGPPGPGPAASAEVAVFFPDPRDWAEFRRAVQACARRGLCTVVEEVGDSVVVETPGHRRRVRFGWHGIRGVGETRDEVGRIAGREPPPVAVVGSSTTVLTVALADRLGDRGSAGPVLLVPWATAVMAGGPRPGSSPVPLLEINPGRTFRFCPNNRRLAESVVDCLLEQDGRKPPGRVVLVVDPHDPYSVDLADCFRRAIRSRAPSAEVVERPDAVGMPTVARSPGVALTPSVAEAALADAIWTAADRSPGGLPTWVVLPLQGDPTRRILGALQSRSSWPPPSRGEGPLRVVCGDGIGRETLEVLAGRKAFPIWCASTSSICPAGLGVSNDTQTLAEVASAVLLAVERSPRSVATPEDVRDALARLDLPEADPSAFGRALRFDPGGERKDAPGFVLALRPGDPAVVEYSLSPDGRWAPARSAPTPTAPGGRP